MDMKDHHSLRLIIYRIGLDSRNNLAAYVSFFSCVKLHGTRARRTAFLDEENEPLP
jgi:hypothetical protein